MPENTATFSAQAVHNLDRFLAFRLTFMALADHPLSGAGHHAERPLGRQPKEAFRLPWHHRRYGRRAEIAFQHADLDPDISSRDRIAVSLPERDEGSGCKPTTGRSVGFRTSVFRHRALLVTHSLRGSEGRLDPNQKPVMEPAKPATPARTPIATS